MRRSIQGVGHMMSTMVLNRKQSVFGAPSLPGGAGAAEPLDRSKFEENEDIVVMETKLKILEILQVAGPGARWEVLGIRQASGGRYSKMGWSGSLRSQCLVLGASVTIGCVAQWFSKCGPQTSSLPWGLRNAGSWALSQIHGPETLERGPTVCAVTSPPSDSGVH